MHTQSVAKEIVLHKLDVDGDELRLGRDGDDDGLVVRLCRLPRSSWRDARQRDGRGVPVGAPHEKMTGDRRSRISFVIIRFNIHVLN